MADEPLVDGAALFSSGLLDSLAFLEMVVFLERRFGVKLAKSGAVTLRALDTFGEVVDRVVAAAAR